MGEYISKTKFEELMNKKSRNYFDLYYADKIREHYNKAIGCSLAADEAHDFPAEDVQPVKYGQWNEIYHDIENYSAICTYCQEPTVRRVWFRPYDFCPHCGAKMIKDGDQ